MTWLRDIVISTAEPNSLGMVVFAFTHGKDYDEIHKDNVKQKGKTRDHIDIFAL